MLLRMMTEVHRALGIPAVASDEELKEMAEPLDPQQLRDRTEVHLRETEE